MEIDLSQPFLDSIDMTIGSSSWTQPLDYETLPFRCRLCHEYGHLLKRCPHASSLGSSRNGKDTSNLGTEKGK